ncbi:MAG: IclR family transcriptional regulator [Candidatus Methylomirabilales bacterium]
MSTVAKVFRILEEVVSHQETGLSYSEVVQRTRLPKASAHRVLKSLLETGYLRFDPEAGRYFGDLKLCVLGAEVTSHFDLRRYIRPHLLQLHAETGHTCHLGVRSGRAGVYLDKIESASSFGFKLYSEIGKRFPLHCTAMGKVLLAAAGDAERRQVLGARLPAFTPHTLTDARRLERELRGVAARGYAVDREEITRGLMCVAAPVRGREGEVVAATSVTFPAYLDKDRGIAREIRAVTRCGAAISAGLQGGARASGGRRTA